eukprot:TRINITY_DN27052_c0_g1_i1.p1 TRINITY_DN27052_c0_g1~~TRINITY_DN27052_c0_g1_i1.p1  ORF type:complete len:123 (+),score=18.38 TRINITY_DN27052_c0_g1_i1:57-425(+)
MVATWFVLYERNGVEYWWELPRDVVERLEDKYSSGVDGCVDFTWSWGANRRGPSGSISAQDGEDAGSNAFAEATNEVGSKRQRCQGSFDAYSLYHLYPREKKMVNAVTHHERRMRRLVEEED